MPRSRKAASKARLAESVSTVEPDFDETTSTVCVSPPPSASPSSAARTCPGEVESRMTSGTPAVCAMTSGASDDPPMPARTTRVTPFATSWARSASISATSGRETVTASTQPSRCDASASASGPHRVGSPAVMPDATRSATRPGSVASTTDLTCPLRWIRKLIERSPARSSEPRSTVSCSSCQDAMNFSTPSSSSTWVTSSIVDADRGELSNTPCASAYAPVTASPRDLTVVERRLERLLGHGVHGARGDELGRHRACREVTGP